MKPLGCVLALFVVLVGASSAEAASGAQVGIQDDAWLLNGPGTLESRLDELDRLGVDVVRYTVRWDVVARQRPATARDHRDPAYDWGSADSVLRGLRRHGIQPLVTLFGTPRVGERRASAELGADRRRAVRRLRACSGDALLVGSPVDHLERAEQAAVAPPDVGGYLRPEAPEPGVCADPRRDPCGACRRRHDRATGRDRRRVAGRLDQGDGVVATEARRLRPPSLPRTPPARDTMGTGVPDLRDDRDGRSRTTRDARPPAARPQADLAHRVRLPDESSGHVSRRLPDHTCAARRECRTAGRARPLRRHAHLLPRARRRGRRRLAEWVHDRRWCEEARVHRFPLPAGADVEKRRDGRPLGTDPPA